MLHNRLKLERTQISCEVDGHTVHHDKAIVDSPFTVNNPIFTLIYEFYLQVRKVKVSSENQFDWTFPQALISERCWYWCNERERVCSAVLCCAETARQLFNVKCSFVIAWTQLGHGSLKLLDPSQSSEKLPHFTWLFEKTLRIKDWKGTLQNRMLIWWRPKQEMVSNNFTSVISAP